MTDLDFDELDRAVNATMSQSGPSPAPAAPADNSSPVARPSVAVKRRGRFMDMVHPSPANRNTGPKPSKPELRTHTSHSITPLASADNMSPQTGSPESAPAMPATPPSAEPELDYSQPLSNYVDTPTSYQPESPATDQEILASLNREDTGSVQVDEPVDDTVGTEQAPQQPKQEPDELPSAAPVSVDEVDGSSVSFDSHYDDSDDFPADSNTAHDSEHLEAELDSLMASIPSAEHEQVHEPLSSPFLPNAKVEKRPLGGIPEEDTQPSEEVSQPEQTEAEPKYDASASMAALLNGEHESTSEHHDTPHQDVLAENELEVAESTATEDQQPIEPPVDMPVEAPEPQQPEFSPQPAAAMEDTAAPTEDDDDLPAREEDVAPYVSPAAAGGPAFAASIPQQYTEAPATKAELAATMYDTDMYQQPIEPKQKSKKALWIVVWIIILLLIGVGVGVASYYFTNS